MAHCHIDEHHESGMIFSFNVHPADASALGANWVRTGPGETDTDVSKVGDAEIA